MSIEILNQNRVVKLFIATLIAVSLVTGCKGKEEKQNPSSPASAKQQEGAAQSQSGSSGITASENSSIPPEVISDSAPKITSLKVSPETPRVGDKIKVEAATFDKEDDNVMLTYYWSKNGSGLSETSDTLSVDLKRGDKIGLTVVPDDGKKKGNPVSVSISVVNSPPVINISQATFRFDGSTYTHQVKATDPDGDPLTYTLKGGPPRMTIDPSTGMITWPVPMNFEGTAQVTVSVTDGYGGETMASFSVKIPPQQKK
jgi:hypothetical protein